MRPKYLGRYRIIAELGKGSVGKVLRGEDEVLNRPVAIKLPNATDDKTIERLREECEALTQLQHPQIAQVYGSGSDPDRPLYIVAEYVDGLSVSGLLVKEKHLEVRRALQIALGVADALVYAHQRQPRVLHLDLKPTNVLVQGDTDQVKVTDFGLASVLTKPGARPTGTREYMAPEQAEGDGPDERADLYSLGVLLYEMLVGKRPPKLAAEPATPPSANTGITFPPELRERVDRLVLGLLARERKARAPQTAEQLAEELRAMLEGRPARLGASSRAPAAPAPSPSPSGGIAVPPTGPTAPPRPSPDSAAPPLPRVAQQPSSSRRAPAPNSPPAPSAAPRPPAPQPVAVQQPAAAPQPLYLQPQPVPAQPKSVMQVVIGRESNKALAAFWLAILSFFLPALGFITAIIAIVLGRSALRDIHQSGEQLQGHQKATAALVISYIVLGLYLLACLVVAGFITGRL